MACESSKINEPRGDNQDRIFRLEPRGRGPALNYRLRNKLVKESNSKLVNGKTQMG